MTPARHTPPTASVIGRLEVALRALKAVRDDIRELGRDGSPVTPDERRCLRFAHNEIANMVAELADTHGLLYTCDMNAVGVTDDVDRFGGAGFWGAAK